MGGPRGHRGEGRLLRQALLIEAGFDAPPQIQSPEKHANIKEYFPETVFDVFPAVAGRKAIVHA